MLCASKGVLAQASEEGHWQALKHVNSVGKQELNPESDSKTD